MNKAQFLELIDKNGPVPDFRPDLGPCWIWQGRLLVSGHGGLSFKPEGGRAQARTAQSVAFEIFKGAIADGLEVDHLCRVRPCVNPDHLEAVTHRENMRRGHFGMKTHCPADHPYAGDNLYLDTRGERQCRTCRRAAFLRFKARERASCAPAP